MGSQKNPKDSQTQSKAVLYVLLTANFNLLFSPQTRMPTLLLPSAQVSPY